MVDLSRLNQEEKLFCSHIEDLIKRCEKKYIPQFTHFLDERQGMIAGPHDACLACFRLITKLWKKTFLFSLLPFPTGERTAFPTVIFSVL